MTPRRALWVLIAVSGLIRLGWAASLGPGNDEAYHYLFTVHPDWSYFDHPPMLAVVEAAGVALCGGVPSTLALRSGFVLLFAGSTWLMARLGGRFFGERAGWLAAFALNVSAYHTAAAGAFALPDGPLLFFWLLTLDRLAAALFDEGGGGALGWASVGLAWGGALLSKYHAVFLPAGALLYLAVEPGARRWLRRPGPYLAAALGLAAFSPVVVWNARHGWASFAFQGGRALGGGGLRADTLLAALFLPALYLLPWVWARLALILVRRGRHLLDPGAPAGERFLLCQAVVPLVTFLGVACTRPVLPHWTLVGFLPLFPMLGRAWEGDRAVDPSRFRRRAVLLAGLPLVAAGAAVAQARTGIFQQGRPGGIGLVSAVQDPTADMVGWDALAGELRRRGLLDDPSTFLFTGSWYHSGQLAFATRGSAAPVLCYHAWDARSFAFWSRPEHWVGRDGLFVAVNEPMWQVDRYDPWFARKELVAAFDVVRGGGRLRSVRVYRCVRQTAPFPFDDLGRSVRPKKDRAGRLASGPAVGVAR